MDTQDPVEIEFRACFINSDTGAVIEILNASPEEKSGADVFGIYTGSPGFFRWCADFQECHHAVLFAETLERYFQSTGVPVINRVKSF
jgi:hypothetical protein